MRAYDYLLVLFFCAALVPADGLNSLALILAFTIVGIPLAFLISAFPALAFILIPARLLDRLIFQRFFPGAVVTGFVAIGAILAASCLFAVVDNKRQSKVVARLLVQDLDNLPRPIDDQKIALVSTDARNGCDNYCQRLLLTGQATAVLVASNKDELGNAVPDFSASAKEFKLENLGICPPPPDSLKSQSIDLVGEPPAPKTQQAYTLILQASVAGRCLTETESTLASADLVIFDGIARRRVAKNETSFASGKDTLLVTRREVWIVMRDGQQVLAARWTHAVAPSLPGIALPMVLPALSFDPHKGFLRTPHFLPERQPGYTTFMQGILGLRLSLMDPDVLQPAQGDPTSGP